VPRVLLNELAYRSGGRARDFVRLVRDLAEEAWQEDVDTATEHTVGKVLDALRRHYEMGLHAGHIDLLKKIADDPEHRLPEDPLAQELLGYGTLLAYANESEWYSTHPLLMMHVVKVAGTSSANVTLESASRTPVPRDLSVSTRRMPDRSFIGEDFRTSQA
jgi:hypothetical protein